MITEESKIPKEDTNTKEELATESTKEEIPLKPESTSTKNTIDDNDDKEVAKVSEPNSSTSSEQGDVEEDDEEIFMQALEQKEEEELKKSCKSHTHLAQDSKEAPTLLRSALDKEEPKKQKVEETAAATTATRKEEEEPDVIKKEFAERGNQLDFLLSKASEYSNFIADDLKELETMKAAEAEAALSSTKKRKRKGAVHTGSGKIGIFTQPANLAKGCVLKDYQLEGVRWLTSLYENGVSGILADEMGLGKTIMVIALIAHLRTKDVSGPFLIVVPLATLPNWVREFNKWLPDSNVCRYHGNAQDRAALWSGPLHPRNKRNSNYPIIITSYEISIKDARKLSKLGEYTFMVVDEGHRLKNHRCTLLQSLKSIPSSNRLLLSGTPIQNNLDELWSLLNFVNPQIFDDLSVFQSWFGFRDIGFRKANNFTGEEQILLEQRTNSTVSKLHEILRPFLLRRVKKDVLKDLPPKREVVVYAGMSKLQVGYYHCIQHGTLRTMLANNGIDVKNGKNVSQTNMQMNHRKNSNHPFLFGEPLDAATGVHIGCVHPELLIRASGKFALLDRMLKRLFADDHQVLIFSQMTAVLNIMEDYLHYRNWKYCRIDGSTQIDDRQRQMDDFNSDSSELFVFLLSTRAGGLGINLVAADTCIIFDSDWNPHQDSQAMDRCHRIGQTRPVGVYRLLTLGSIDIEMMEKQMSKKKLERMTVVGGDFRKAGLRSRGEFSQEQLQTLLSNDIKDIQQKTLVAGKSEDISIEDDEFNKIMDRKTLFSEELQKEGNMYDVVEQNNVSILGAVQD